MKRVLLAAVLLCSLATFAQRTNTYYPYQFPGSDVATKVMAAQAACSSATPCVIVFDPILAAYPSGSMPARCSNCVWMDYRTAGQVQVNGTNIAAPQLPTGWSISGSQMLAAARSNSAPSYSFAGATNLGLLKDPYHGSLVVINGSAAYSFGGGLFSVGTAAVIGWSGDPSSGNAADTGFSRPAAGTVAIGNGAQYDTTGNLQLNSVTKYLGVSTVGAGVAPIWGQFSLQAVSSSLTAQSVLAAANVSAGLYRFSCYVVLTQAATTSSTLPACYVQYTDRDSNTAMSVAVTSTSTTNTLGTAVGEGEVVINAKSAVSITLTTTGYVSSGTTAMQYSVRAKLDYLGQ